MKSVLSTDAGMHLLWDRAQFGSVHDYDSWSLELENDADITRHIEAGAAVPINIDGDGAYLFDVRLRDHDGPTLSDDEDRRLVARSDPYRFRSEGHVDVSGIEFVQAEPDPQRVLSIAIAPGLYDVTIHLLDYDDVPERGDDHPDFIVVLEPGSAPSPRLSIETFDRTQP